MSKFLLNKKDIIREINLLEKTLDVAQGTRNHTASIEILEQIQVALIMYQKHIDDELFSMKTQKEMVG